MDDIFIRFLVGGLVVSLFPPWPAFFAKEFPRALRSRPLHCKTGVGRTGSDRERRWDMRTWADTITQEERF
jgi:hypothetical protein